MKSIIISLLLLSTSVFSQEVRKFGWIGDSGQKRVLMMAPHAWPIEIPSDFSDLSKGLPSVMDQGDIGSCVAQSTAVAWSFAHNKANGDQMALSRLLIYYEARRAIGTINVDSGCQIVDAINWLSRGGSCKERLWPYKVQKFRLQAPNCAYNEAKSHLVVSARKVDNADRKSIRLALTNGYPVVVGSMVYSGIMDLNNKNSVLPMPRRGERPVGGHAYLISGHDDKKRLYLARNSWGERWGASGSFYVPYDYIHSARITEDCWVIITVSNR